MLLQNIGCYCRLNIGWCYRILGWCYRIFGCATEFWMQLQKIGCYCRLNIGWWRNGPQSLRGHYLPATDKGAKNASYGAKLFCGKVGLDGSKCSRQVFTSLQRGHNLLTTSEGANMQTRPTTPVVQQFGAIIPLGVSRTPKALNG